MGEKNNLQPDSQPEYQPDSQHLTHAGNGLKSAATGGLTKELTLTLPALPSRNWVEINLANLIYNYQLLKAQVDSETIIMGIVKAGAYGHGAVEVSKALVSAGIRYLGVASLDEALELRRADIRVPILILGDTDVNRAEEIITNDITQTIFRDELVRVLNEVALKLNHKAKVHIKLNTGMNRVGLDITADSVREICQINTLPGIEVEGLFTHFATAEAANHDYLEYQFAAFNKIVAKLAEYGIKPRLLHCANSPATLLDKKYHLNMVRVGGLLYGLNLNGSIRGSEPFKPVLSWHARIVQVKDIKAGATIGYGCAYTLPRDSKIAVVAVGYADGLSRSLSNRCEALIHGQKIKQVGNICMDMCMFDLTDLPNNSLIKPGEIITLIGDFSHLQIKTDSNFALRSSCCYNYAGDYTNSNELIKAGELAEVGATIDYEVTSTIGVRAKRIFIVGYEQS